MRGALGVEVNIMERPSWGARAQALFLIGILILSFMPAALAAEASEPDATTDAAKVTAVRIRTVDNGQDLPGHAFDDVKVRGRSAKNILAPAGVAPERIAQARKLLRREGRDLAVARQQYQMARQRYAERRAILVDARQRFKRCADDTSEECQAVRERLRQQAPDFLVKSADVMLEALARTATRIEESELEDGVKAQLLAELEERTAKVLAAKEAAEALGEDATAEDIREVARQLRAAWREARRSMRFGLGQSISVRVRTHVEQTERLGSRLETVAAELDDEVLQAAVEQFVSLVQEAKAEYALAAAAYQDEASQDGNAAVLVSAANEHLREAARILKEARQQLREIVRRIKELRGDLSIVDAQRERGAER